MQKNRHWYSSIFVDYFKHIFNSNVSLNNFLSWFLYDKIIIYNKYLIFLIIKLKKLYIKADYMFFILKFVFYKRPSLNHILNNKIISKIRAVTIQYPLKQFQTGK